MRRRRSSAQSSFDLFLDTVCNTFGGILFIAILIAVQIRQTDATSSQQKSPSAEAIQQLQGELESLAAEIKAAQGVLDAVRTSMPAPTNPADVQTIEDYERRIEEIKALSEIKTDLLAQYLSIMQSIAELEETLRTLEKKQAELELSAQKLVEIISELRAAIDRLNQSIMDAQNMASRIEREIVQKGVRIASAQEAVNRLEKEVAQKGEQIAAANANVRTTNTNTRMEVLHLPKLHDPDPNKSFKYFVLHNKGFYLLDTSGGRMNPPRPGSVIRVDDTAASRAALGGLLRGFPPNTYDISIFVHTDSFDCFHLVRDCAIALGFRYTIIPTDHLNRRFSSDGRRGPVQ